MLHDTFAEHVQPVPTDPLLLCRLQLVETVWQSPLLNNREPPGDGPTVHPGSDEATSNPIPEHGIGHDDEIVTEPAHWLLRVPPLLRSMMLPVPTPEPVHPQLEPMTNVNDADTDTSYVVTPPTTHRDRKLIVAVPAPRSNPHGDRQHSQLPPHPCPSALHGVVHTSGLSAQLSELVTGRQQQSGKATVPPVDPPHRHVPGYGSSPPQISLHRWASPPQYPESPGLRQQHDGSVTLGSPEQVHASEPPQHGHSDPPVPAVKRVTFPPTARRIFPVVELRAMREAMV